MKKFILGLLIFSSVLISVPTTRNYFLNVFSDPNLPPVINMQPATAILSQPTTYPFTANLKPGLKNNGDVKALQSILMTQNFLTGTADGNFGPATTAAVKKFQKMNGLTADGSVGPMTRKILSAIQIASGTSVPTSSSSTISAPTVTLTAPVYENSSVTLKFTATTASSCDLLRDTKEYYNVYTGSSAGTVTKVLDVNTSPSADYTISCVGPGGTTVSNIASVVYTAPVADATTPISQGNVMGEPDLITPPPTGNTALSGTVLDTNGASVSGGVVQVLSGSSVVASLPISNGAYSSSSLTAGTYTLKLQPSLQYSLGPNEPDTKSVTVPTNSNFVVQKAVYATDFQSFTSVNDLTRGQTTSQCSQGIPIPSGGFWYAPTGPTQTLGCTNPSQISLDPTGGPEGTKAMVYNYNTNPPVNPPSCPITDYTINLVPTFINSTPTTNGSLWIRWTDKLSPGFIIGSILSPSCSNELKYLLVNIGSSSGTTGRMGLYLDYDQTARNIQAVTVLNDSDGNSTSPGTGGTQRNVIGTIASFTGIWHTWDIQIYNVGTSATVFKVYLDGTYINGQTGSYYPLRSLAQASALWSIQMGANMNTGPDNTEQRLWREFGVYNTRPSLVPLAQ